MSLYVPQRHDIILQNPDDQFVAVVEVRNMQGLSRELATVLRGQGMTYTLLPQTPYFLLLSQDVGFLWKESWREGPETPPTYEFPMGNVISRYVEGYSGERLFNREVESLVIKWLTDLANGKQEVVEEPEKTLAIAGFYNAIRGASVSIGVGAEE